nr:hypothetical protein CFP56_65167 [Quercus suber]
MDNAQTESESYVAAFEKLGALLLGYMLLALRQVLRIQGLSDGGKNFCGLERERRVADAVTNTGYEPSHLTMLTGDHNSSAIAHSQLLLILQYSSGATILQKFDENYVPRLLRYVALFTTKDRIGAALSVIHMIDQAPGYPVFRPSSASDLSLQSWQRTCIGDRCPSDSYT